MISRHLFAGLALCAALFVTGCSCCHQNRCRQTPPVAVAAPGCATCGPPGAIGVPPPPAPIGAVPPTGAFGTSANGAGVRYR